MVGRESKAENGVSVLLRAVSLMLCKAVSRKERIKLFHVGIPGNLGHNRCGCNGENGSVTAHNGPLLALHTRNFVPPINGHAKPGVFHQGRRELPQCPIHGQKCCLPNIQFIDLINTGPSERHMSGLAMDQTGKLITSVWREAL